MGTSIYTEMKGPCTHHDPASGMGVQNPLDSQLLAFSLLLVDFALPVANKLVLTSDRVYLFACILPGDLLFCAPEGRIAPIGASYPEWIILSRIGDLIPKR